MFFSKSTCFQRDLKLCVYCCSDRMTLLQKKSLAASPMFSSIGSPPAKTRVGPRAKSSQDVVSRKDCSVVSAPAQEFFELLREEKNEMALFCSDALVLRRHTSESSDKTIKFLEKMLEIRRNVSRKDKEFDAQIIKEELSKTDAGLASEFFNDFRFYKKHKDACLDQEHYRRNTAFAKDLDINSRMFPYVVIAIVHASVSMQPNEAINLLSRYRIMFSKFFEKDNDETCSSVHCLQASYYRVLLHFLTLSHEVTDSNMIMNIAQKMLDEHPSFTNQGAYMEAVVVASKIMSTCGKTEELISPTKLRKRPRTHSCGERIQLLMNTWKSILNQNDTKKHRMDEQYDTLSMDRSVKRPRLTEERVSPKQTPTKLDINLLENIVKRTKELVKTETNHSIVLSRSSRRFLAALASVITEIATISNNIPSIQILISLNGYISDALSDKDRCL